MVGYKRHLIDSILGNDDSGKACRAEIALETGLYFMSAIYQRPSCSWLTFGYIEKERKNFDLSKSVVTVCSGF